MLSRFSFLTLLALAGTQSLTAQAGGHCRLRQGGCSDPCAVAAYSIPTAQCGSYTSGQVVVGTAYTAPIGCGASSALAPAPATVQESVDCGPVTLYKVVLEPQIATETRVVPTTEYRDEVRYRTRTVQRTVPVEVQEYRSKTVLVPKTETKTIEYSVLVPKTSEKTVELVETVPVWNEVTENYTVKVPKLNDVPEEYEVKVAQLVDEQFTYTVQVPVAETQTKLQTVTNAVPVTKTRSIQVSVPVSKTQSVTKDYGHWQTLVEEVAVASAPVQTMGAVSSVGCATSASIQVGGCGSYVGGCGVQVGCGQVARCGVRSRGCSACKGASNGCSSCQNGCGAMVAASATAGCAPGMVSNESCGASVAAVPATRTVTRRVWVPNVVTEEVPVVENVLQTQEVSYTVYEQHSEQVPYECTVVSYRPETRTGTRKVVTYVPEKRTRTRKVVSYSDETRTRTRKEVRYEQKTRSETIPVVSYSTEKRTKEVSFTVNVPETQVEPYTSTRFETISEDVTEEYTERVPFASAKEVQVQVTRLVPKLVPYQVNPCAMTAPVSGTSMMSGMTSGGCGCAVPAPMPAQTIGGCTTCR